MSTPQTDLANLPLFDLGFMLTASKRSDYRRNMFALAEAIANVLTDEQLVTVDLRSRFAEKKEHFRVTIGELVPEAASFALSYHGWLKKIDRWKTERTVAKLEQSLRETVAAYRKSSS